MTCAFSWHIAKLTEDERKIWCFWCIYFWFNRVSTKISGGLSDRCSTFQWFHQCELHQSWCRCFGIPEDPRKKRYDWKRKEKKGVTSSSLLRKMEKLSRRAAINTCRFFQHIVRGVHVGWKRWDGKWNGLEIRGAQICSTTLLTTHLECVKKQIFVWEIGLTIWSTTNLCTGIEILNNNHWTVARYIWLDICVLHLPKIVRYMNNRYKLGTRCEQLPVFCKKTRGSFYAQSLIAYYFWYIKISDNNGSLSTRK